MRGGINPLLIVRNAGSALRSMPFYLRHEKVVVEKDDQAGRRRIGREVRDFLRAEKNRRQAALAPVGEQESTAEQGA